MKLPIYFPGSSIGAEPFHEVFDWCKVRSMMRFLIKGGKLPEIIIEGDIGNCRLITGTHRCAAYDILLKLGYNIVPNVVNVINLPEYNNIIDLLENNDFSTINEIFDSDFEKERKLNKFLVNPNNIE